MISSTAPTPAGVGITAADITDSDVIDKESNIEKTGRKLRYHGKINIPLVEGCTIADFYGVEKFGKTVLLVLYSVFNSVWNK